MEALKHGAEQIAEEAKTNVIGHEQPDWEPLADATIERKQRGGYATPAPLLRTGGLRDSIETVTTMTHAEIGSNHEDAVAHEHGNEHEPPRPFLRNALEHKMPEIVEELTLAMKLAVRTTNG